MNCLNNYVTLGLFLSVSNHPYLTGKQLRTWTVQFECLWWKVQPCHILYLWHLASYLTSICLVFF
jgi:hypothetical protein